MPSNSPAQAAIFFTLVHLLNAQRIAFDRDQRPIALPFGVAQVIFFAINFVESEADLMTSTAGLFAAFPVLDFVPAFESHADVGAT